MTQTVEIQNSVYAAERRGRGLALAVLLVGAFLPPLDYFIVNLALPAIQGGLGATNAQLQLVVSSYAYYLRGLARDLYFLRWFGLCCPKLNLKKRVWRLELSRQRFK